MKKILLFLTVVGVAITACTDKSTFRNPSHHQLENGAFARFVNENAIAPNQVLDFNISQDIFDANGNIESYTLTVYANLSGSLKIAEDFLTIDSFPATLNLTSESIAAALGVNSSIFDYGDIFKFVAKATRNDGVVFYGQNPSYDPDTGTVGLGNTEGQLTNVPAYKNAMTFDFLLFNDCPPVPGTYELVLHDSYGDGWQGKGIKITIDGVAQYHVLCDYWGNVDQDNGCYPVPGDPSGNTYSTEVIVPTGTQSWIWKFLGDAYPTEVSFELYDPSGLLIYEIAAPEEGQLYVINCL